MNQGHEKPGEEALNQGHVKPDATRRKLLGRGVRLEYFTIAYNLLEALVAAASSGLVGMIGTLVTTLVEEIAGMLTIMGMLTGILSERRSTPLLLLFLPWPSTSCFSPAIT